MRPPELRTLRQALGLTGRGLGLLLGVSDRTVRRWEAGDWPVPADAAALVRDLHRRHGQMAAWCVQQARETGASVVMLERWEDAADYCATHADTAGMPPEAALQLHHGLLSRVACTAQTGGLEVALVAAQNPQAVTSGLVG